ncbi:sensor histidine kinase [Actinomyces oricola]|uniref:sensor histidine kinase n=1 Tax=Actinomyces oricola TaxID=206043 RepID=UPI0013E89B4E|nr:histidine kinase [Actinomyces oricola]
MPVRSLSRELLSSQRWMTLWQRCRRFVASKPGVSALMLLGLVFLSLDFQDEGTISSIILGLVSVAALPFLDRFPWPTTAVISGCALYISGTAQIGTALLVAFFTISLLTRAARYRQVSFLVLAIAMGVPVAAFAGRFIAAVYILYLLVTVLSVVIGLTMRRADRNLAQAESARQEALRAQRTLIARELHDTLARANTQMVLRAEQAKAATSPDDQIREVLDDIIATGRRSVTDLRIMLRVLRQDTVTPSEHLLTSSGQESIAAALDQAAGMLRDRGLHISTHLEGDESVVSPALLVSIVRVIDECAANMLKHAARDADCSIQVEIGAEEVIILSINPISDQAPARRDAALSSNYGLLGLEERASSRGGHLTFTESGHLWVLSVTFPIDTKAV